MKNGIKSSKPTSKRNAILRGVAVSLLIFAVVSNIITAAIPVDTTWTHYVNYPRSGLLYTYLYNYDQILGDPNKDLWLNDIATTFDYVFLIAPWGSYFIDNNTLDTVGLTNLTVIAKELGERGCQVVIHTWYSSYAPTWLNQYVPELNNQGVRWQGLTLDNPHYDILMNTNLQYLRLLSTYLMSQNVTNIYGFCLDDETATGNWAKVCVESTKLLHTYNSTWKITAMFSSSSVYWMASGMDYLAMDPYSDDSGIVARMEFGFSLDVGKISVLLNGMDTFSQDSYNRMRRQAWIAWFEGADTIGYWCYNIYWNGYRGSDSNNWFFMPYNSTGPQSNPKDQAVKDFRSDLMLLKTGESKRLNALDAGNVNLATRIQDIMEKAYSYAKNDDFTNALINLQEVNSL